MNNTASILFKLLKKSFSTIRDDLLCCGFVGSLERDIDLLCVLDGKKNGVPSSTQISKIIQILRDLIIDAEKINIHLYPFTSFRTEIFIKHHNCSYKNCKSLPFHILLYPGMNGLILCEFPLIIKSLVKSVQEITPTNKSLLRDIELINISPLKQSIFRYIALVIETQVLLNISDKEKIHLEEVYHKTRYVVKYSLAEYLYTKGELSLENIGSYFPSITELFNFTEEKHAKELFKLMNQKYTISAMDKYSANQICSSTLRFLEIILEIISDNDKSLT